MFSLSSSSTQSLLFHILHQFVTITENPMNHTISTPTTKLSRIKDQVVMAESESPSHSHDETSHNVYALPSINILNIDIDYLILDFITINCQKIGSPRLEIHAASFKSRLFGKKKIKLYVGCYVCAELMCRRMPINELFGIHEVGPPWRQKFLS